MIGRGSITSICMICALAVSALAAQTAAATTTGTTTVTCLKVSPAGGTKGFSDAKCKNAVATNASYEHFEFIGGTSTTYRGGLSKLHSVISGVEVELQSTELTGSGTTENMQAASGEHTVSSRFTVQQDGTFVAKPPSKGCAVKGGQIKTKELKATTAGQEMGLKVEPAEGTLLAEFTIEGCSIAALNGKYELKGSFVATPEGTENVTTAAGTTAQGTLKLRGQNAGIAAAIETVGESGTPLAKTTFTTP